jgi:hypothetical protein
METTRKQMTERFQVWDQRAHGHGFIVWDTVKHEIAGRGWTRTTAQREADRLNQGR